VNRWRLNSSGASVTAPNAGHYLVLHAKYPIHPPELGQTLLWWNICKAAKGTLTFTPHILAEVRLLKTAEGGRERATRSDFFDCSAGGEYFEMRMDLRGIGSLSPGSTAQVPIQFLHPEDVLPCLWVGAVFSLREAGKIIGPAKFLSETLAAEHRAGANGHCPLSFRLSYET
jgi:hypothetical protein